jgi:hypothetical protein
VLGVHAVVQVCVHVTFFSICVISAVSASLHGYATESVAHVLTAVSCTVSSSCSCSCSCMWHLSGLGVQDESCSVRVHHGSIMAAAQYN